VRIRGCNNSVGTYVLLVSERVKALYYSSLSFSAHQRRTIALFPTMCLLGCFVDLDNTNCPRPNVFVVPCSDRILIQILL
jgi:hypothetical protein